MSRLRYGIISGILGLAACFGGCSQTPAAHSPDEAEASDAAESSGKSEPSDSPKPKSSATDETNDEGAEAPAKKESGSEPAEPSFTENMSVDEATKAVPAGFERRNIDQETLGKPLQDASVYEPCKPGSARVKLRVAVWQGRAVGVDVTTTPKNDKLSECIKGRIRELKWDAKVKSLNTIEYQL